MFALFAVIFISGLLHRPVTKKEWAHLKNLHVALVFLPLAKKVVIAQFLDHLIATGIIQGHRTAAIDHLIEGSVEILGPLRDTGDIHLLGVILLVHQVDLEGDQGQEVIITLIL